jgi:acyl-CoA thioester hydrolase
MVRVTPRNRADYSAFSTLATRWIDNDIYGHMNNAVHYQLFDTAVNGYLLEQGALNLKSGATVFLVVETGCQYFSELAFPDVITAGM